MKAIFSHARWIWSPEASAPIAGMFILFRHAFELKAKPVTCRGWIWAETSYRLYVNGVEVQGGPAVADPRWPEVDPVNLEEYLRPGPNVIAVEVGYFGSLWIGGGDDQWIGSPRQGLIFEAVDETSRPVAATGKGWRCRIDDARPIWNRRNYARFFRERFDARKRDAWVGIEYADDCWSEAIEADIDPDKPPCKGRSKNDPELEWGAMVKYELLRRSIPLLKTEQVQPIALAQAGALAWRVNPEWYFDYLVKDAVELKPYGEDRGSGIKWPVLVNRGGESSAVATFEFKEEITGYPELDVEAAAGTIIDLIFHEKKFERPLWLDEWRNSVRVICREGRTRFKGFDYEAIKYMQVVVREATGPVLIHRAGASRQSYPFPQEGGFESSDAVLNRVYGAAANTLKNNLQDYLMDNVRRERGAYGCWPAATGACYALGAGGVIHRAHRLVTQSESPEGWIFEGWPGYTRLGQMPGVYMHRFNGATPCLVDGVILTYPEIYNYYMYTADKTYLDEMMPCFKRNLLWLLSKRRRDGLLPLRPSMWHMTWVDHFGGGTEATLNLMLYYVLKKSWPDLCRAWGQEKDAQEALAAAAEIAATLKSRYWKEEAGIMIAGDMGDGIYRAHEITVAFSLLSELVPETAAANSVKLLTEYPLPIRKSWIESRLAVSKGKSREVHMGIAHPCNTIWRYLALAKYGRADVIVRDINERWGKMLALKENNTLAEDWETADGGPQLGFAVRCQTNPVIPEVLYRCILGLEPVKPGWTEFRVNPQLGSLAWVRGQAWTPQGPVQIELRKDAGDRIKCSLRHPPALTPRLAGHVISVK